MNSLQNTIDWFTLWRAKLTQTENISAYFSKKAPFTNIFCPLQEYFWHPSRIFFAHFKNIFAPFTDIFCSLHEYFLFPSRIFFAPFTNIFGSLQEYFLHPSHIKYILFPFIDFSEPVLFSSTSHVVYDRRWRWDKASLPIKLSKKSNNANIAAYLEKGAFCPLRVTEYSLILFLTNFEVQASY